MTAASRLSYPKSLKGMSLRWRLCSVIGALTQDCGNVLLNHAASAGQCASMDFLLDRRDVQRSLMEKQQTGDRDRGRAYEEATLLAALDAYLAAAAPPPASALLRIYAGRARLPPARATVLPHGGLVAKPAVAARVARSMPHILAATWARRRAAVLCRAIALAADSDNEAGK